jgi:hypothetical protein
MNIPAARVEVSKAFLNRTGTPPCSLTLSRNVTANPVANTTAMAEPAAATAGVVAAGNRLGGGLPRNASKGDAGPASSPRHAGWRYHG